MKKGKFESVTPRTPTRRRRRNSGAKLGLLILAITMLVGSTLGGTLAYLTDQTASVQNTFTVGDVGDLTLAESKGNSYVVVPGVDITKDPTLTYTGNNIDAYIFVKIEGDKWNVSTDGTTFTMGAKEEMKWTLADGWTKLKDGVYYREVGATAATATQTYSIIADNKITVSSAITEATIANYASELTFTAYAIQAAGFEDDVAGAWDALNNQ